MMLSLAEYADHDGLELATLVHSGAVSATELMEAALTAIDRLNPQLNAVVREMRPEAEAAIAAGLPNGPYRGVPFLLKDLTPTYAHVPATGGSRFFNGLVRRRGAWIPDWAS